MSIVHVNQIASKVKHLFSSLIDISDLPNTDKDRESKILTRCLAAYAIHQIGEASEIDAAASVIDGGDDNGIDAVYYSPSTKRLVVVQSKWIKDGIGEPDNGDIRKFKDGILDLVNLNFDRFNKKFEKRKESISAALSEYDTKIEVALIHTGSNGLSHHNQRVIDDLLKELNDAGDGAVDDVVTFHHLKQSSIHASLASGLDGEPIDLDIGLTQWGKVDEPHLAFYGMVSGEEVANWWKLHGKKLFSKNIRKMLGTTDVNDEVRATLEKAPENFWYFNNGITLIADSIKKSMVGGNSRDLGSFRVLNASVVNGAQTVSVIGKHLVDGGTTLDKVRVPIRLISLENSDESFGEKITKTNNRQNKIENRDFVSLDDEQIRIRRELLIEGIDYNITRTEGFKISKHAIDLSEATVALACCSGQVNLTVQAKREVGKFYEDLTKAPYKAIYNSNTTGILVRNSVWSLREIDAALSRRINKLSEKSGREYGALVHGNRFIAMLVFNNIGQKQKKLEDTQFKSESFDWDGLVLVELGRLTSVLSSSYQGKLLGTLFKNATICRKLAEETSASI